MNSGDTEDPGTGTTRLRESIARLRERVKHDDAEVVAYWRQASPEAHAQAMIELAAYAEMMVAHTGLAKPSNEMFPGFPATRDKRTGEAGGRAA